MSGLFYSQLLYEFPLSGHAYRSKRIGFEVLRMHGPDYFSMRPLPIKMGTHRLWDGVSLETVADRIILRFGWVLVHFALISLCAPVLLRLRKSRFFGEC